MVPLVFGFTSARSPFPAAATAATLNLPQDVIRLLARRWLDYPYGLPAGCITRYLHEVVADPSEVAKRAIRKFGSVQQAFIEEARRGDMQTVPKLFKRWPEFESDRKTVLESAFVASCGGGHLQLANFIYTRQRSLCATDPDRPMKEAVMYDHVHVIEYLDILLPATNPQKFVDTAIEKNAINALRGLLERGASPNLAYRSDQTSLALAARLGRIDAAILLLDFGADVDHRCYRLTAMHLAAQHGQTAFVEFLLARGAKTDGAPTKFNIHTPLIEACAKGHTETARALLRAGANYNACYDYALIVATRNDFAPIALMLVDHCYALTYPPRDDDLDHKRFESYRTRAFNLATAHNAQQTVHMLLARVDAGAYSVDLNTKHKVDTAKRARLGEIRLAYAAACGHPKIVSALLEWGVPVDARAKNGNTPLMGTKTAQVAELLLHRGADPNAVAGRSGRTPLACIAKLGHTEVVKVLLDHGAKIDAVDHRGRTALMRACVLGKSNAITALVSAGSALNVADRIGWTALMHAAVNNSLAAATVLVDAGADVNVKDFMGRTTVELARGDWYKRKFAELLGVDVPLRKKSRARAAAKAASLIGAVGL